jgi:AraC-like DNA-binding protein
VASGEHDRVRAWRPAVPGVSEVFQAHIVDHAYPRHTHDTWCLFIVDAGAIAYDLHRHHLGADPPMVTALPPGVAHDGRPASSAGFRKRVLYLDTTLLGEDLVGPAVDRPVVSDPDLRRRVGAVHDLLADPGDALAAESGLALVVERLRAHLGCRATAAERPGELAEALRALLDERLDRTVTLAAAAARLGASPARLVRAFSRTFGLPPHAYVLGRRIDASRRLLLDGVPPADVALGVGFYDQAHFTRHFRAHMGTTPGRFAGAQPSPVGPASRRRPRTRGSMRSRLAS